MPARSSEPRVSCGVSRLAGCPTSSPSVTPPSNRLAAVDPLLATEMGLPEHQDRWPDLSPDGLAAHRQVLADIRVEAAACPTPDDRSALASRVLLDYCDAELALHDADYHLRDLNNIVCPHQSLRFVFGSMAADTAEDWEAILARVETIGEPLAGWQATLEEGRRQGLTAARRQVEAVVEQGRLTAGPDSPFDELADEAGRGRAGRRWAGRSARPGHRGGQGRLRRLQRPTWPAPTPPTPWRPTPSARIGTRWRPGSTSAPTSTWPPPTDGGGTRSSGCGPTSRRPAGPSTRRPRWPRSSTG